MLFNAQFYILRLCSVFCFVDFARFSLLGAEKEWPFEHVLGLGNLLKEVGEGWSPGLATYLTWSSPAGELHALGLGSVWVASAELVPHIDVWSFCF